MDGLNGLLVLAAGALGLVTGLVAALAFRWSEHEQHTLPAARPPELDEGLVRVLAVLRSAAVVLDDTDAVVRASPPAYAYGVVREGRVVPPAIRDLVADVRRTGEIRDEELEIDRGPVGPGTLLVQVRVAQVGPHLMLVLAEDRTAARRLEAMRRDFVVNVSHELKTPVGALALLAETVADAADDPEQVRRFAAQMSTEAARLTTLVQEIAELSRLQVVDALAEPVVVDVDAVVAEAVDRAGTTAAAAGVALVAPEPSGLTVIGDHALLVTALRNLLDNAVAYSGAGTRVGIGVREAEGLVEVSVTDQGIGIPPDQVERIFERFYRIDPARSRRTGGTGLGLSIVKHVAIDHGGEVTVWSRPGTGSTFTLRIPAGRLPSDSDLPPLRPTRPGAAA